MHAAIARGGRESGPREGAGAAVAGQLDGVLSPVDGIGPENLNLKNLPSRVRAGKVRELIVATNPTVEGDATALYIARSVAELGCTVTRLARGLPMGGTLEFVDDTTLARAIDRREAL